MCGIVGFTGSSNAASVLIEGLKKLEYRGYDSAGIAVLEDGDIRIVKTKGRIAQLEAKLSGDAPVTGTTGIGHTRWATHGAPTDVNAHPLVSDDGRFAIVHNGIIENHEELRKELEAKGIVFKSETDTEVVAQLIGYYYKGDARKAIMKTAARLEGSYALGIVCSDCPDTVFAMKQASPLILGLGVGENFFASDITALISHTKNVIYLDDGEFAEISPDAVTVYGAVGKPVEKPVSRVTWSVEAAEKGGYEHFMLKEIMEQPAAVEAALNPRIRNGEIVLDDFELSREYLEGVNKIIITACGSAYYAGCTGKYAIEKLCRIPVETELASELRYSDPIIDGHTLAIVISQSGETADTKEALLECRKRGAKTIGIVNVVGSAIAKQADHVLYTYAGPEIAVATTKGFTTQVAVLYLLAVYMGRRKGLIDTDTYTRLIFELEMLPQLIQRTFDMNHGIRAIADKIYKSRSLFFIGRNTDYAAALEGALKMKEISYIHAESYAAGELKHGTIALIEDGQVVIAACCNEQLLKKTLSNVIEVKARGAEVIAIALKDNRDVVAQADYVIYVPRIETVFTAILEVVPMQLLAYYTAYANGCDIDKPKNLAKSVTVE